MIRKTLLLCSAILCLIYLPALAGAEELNLNYTVRSKAQFFRLFVHKNLTGRIMIDKQGKQYKGEVEIDVAGWEKYLFRSEGIINDKGELVPVRMYRELRKKDGRLIRVFITVKDNVATYREEQSLEGEKKTWGDTYDFALEPGETLSGTVSLIGNFLESDFKKLLKNGQMSICFIYQNYDKPKAPPRKINFLVKFKGETEDRYFVQGYLGLFFGRGADENFSEAVISKKDNLPLKITIEDLFGPLDVEFIKKQ